MNWTATFALDRAGHLDKDVPMANRIPLIQTVGTLTFCAFLHGAPARQVQLADEWTFFDPEGNSSIANQSAAGFEVTVADIRKTIPDPDNAGTFLEGNAVRPRVYQIFEDLDMTKIADGIEVSFDLELMTPVLESNRGDLHLSLFDTSTNYEFIPLMHLGPNLDREGVGDFIKFRIDGFVTPDSATFDPDNIVGMGSGGNSRAGQAHHPGKPLAETGIVHHFKLGVERISVSELSFRIDWSYRASGPPAENPILGTSTYSFASYDETSGVIDGEPDAATSDIWANSKLTQFNGFGLMLHDDDPFDQDDDDGSFDQGTIKVSNFAVEYLTFEHPPFGITEITYGAASNTVQWEALEGASYSVWTSTDLISWLELDDAVVAMGNLGEYIHEMPAASERRYYQVRWDPSAQ